MRVPWAPSFFAKSWIALFLLVCLSSDANANEPLSSYSGPIMGTSYQVKVRGLPPIQLKKEIEKVLERINLSMSTYIDDSEISRFNDWQKIEPMKVSSDFLRVLGLAKQVYRTSEKAFDPTINPLVRLWGFGPDKKPTVVPSQSTLKTLLSRLGFDKIKFDQKELLVSKELPNLTLDFSAIAKGDAADQVAEMLQSFGIKNYMIEVGGEVLTGGSKAGGAPWVIGVEIPSDNVFRKAAHAVKLGDLALATSGDYRNYFEIDGKRLSHIISPVTGRPIEHDMASVSVLSQSCALADAYATAFMVLGRKKTLAIARREKLPVLVIYRDGGEFKVETAAGFEDYLINRSF